MINIKFVKNFVLILLSRIIVGFNQLLLAGLLSGLAGIKYYGLYKYYISIFMIFSIFTLSETHRFIIKYLNISSNYLLYFLKIKINFSFLGSFIIFCFFIYFQESIYLIFAIIFPFYFVSDVIVSYYYGKKFFNKLSKLLIIRSFSQVVLTILSWILFKNILLTVCFFLFSYFLINILFFFKEFNFYIFFKKIKTKKNLMERKILYKIILFSIVSYLGVLTLNLDKILISKILNSVHVGIYSLSLIIGMTFFTLIKSAISTFNPYMVKVKIKNVYYVLGFFLGSVIGIIFYFLLYYVSVNFFNKDYIIESIQLSKILLFSIGIYIVYIVYYNFMFYNIKNDEFVVLKNDIVVNGLIVILMVVIYFLNINDFLKLKIFLFLYPLKYCLNIIILYLLSRKKSKDSSR